MMKRIALALAAVIGLTAATAASAGSMSPQELHRVATLRHISKVVVVDTGAISDPRWIYSRRAMTSKFPLTPLQVAIASNPVLMAQIRATMWSFDLKSAYSIYIGDDGRVVIYLGEPPT